MATESCEMLFLTVGGDVSAGGGKSVKGRVSQVAAKVGEQTATVSICVLYMNSIVCAQFNRVSYSRLASCFFAVWSFIFVSLPLLVVL